MLKNLLNDAPRNLPLIRIFDNCITFNGPAAKLMNIKEGDSVSIMVDDRDGLVYVSNCASMRITYPLVKRRNTYLLRNAPLCRQLAFCLDGMGTYRIDTAAPISYMDHSFYNIFKKRYGGNY